MPTLSDIYASTVLAAGIPGRITAGGPGSGRHPGFGSFTKAKSKKVGQTQWTRYSAPSATGLAQSHVDVHHAGHQVKIYEGMGGKFGSSSQGKYFGDRTGAKELLSKTYGISHKFKASALEAGGKGSGCRGENCGRHGGGKGTDKTHLPKKATVPKSYETAETKPLHNLLTKSGWEKVDHHTYQHKDISGKIKISPDGSFSHIHTGDKVRSGKGAGELSEHLGELEDNSGIR